MTLEKTTNLFILLVGVEQYTDTGEIMCTFALLPLRDAFLFFFPTHTIRLRANGKNIACFVTTKIDCKFRNLGRLPLEMFSFFSGIFFFKSEIIKKNPYLALQT